jgi:UDP-N-acetylmuramate dehydrogenase
MIHVSEYTDARDHCTFRIGGKFRYFAEIKDTDDLRTALDFAGAVDTPFLVLGEGSNIVFGDGILNILAGKIKIKGFSIIQENKETVDIKAGAGEIWDEFAERVVQMGYSGVEALSSIPGTVGATPVQNVGAFGCEVGNIILSVEVYDIFDGMMKVISNGDCRFGYRESIFNRVGKGRYIITTVTFRLSKLAPEIPRYPDTLKYFSDKNLVQPTVQEIREAIITIRSYKLPDPRIIPNTGSFFKNPVVENRIADAIKAEYPDVVIFPFDGKHSKIPAGWLMEKSGLKGKSFGRISVYEKNALVLINRGGATEADLMKAKKKIVDVVREKFGITLEQEPAEIKNPVIFPSE